MLAIDDDPNVIYLLQENLTEAGYQVIGATDGTEGLQKAQHQTVAIILDILMPHKDGWQVLHELKTDPPEIFLCCCCPLSTRRSWAIASALSIICSNPLIARLIWRRYGASRARPLLLVVDDDPHVVDLVRQLLDDLRTRSRRLLMGRQPSPYLGTSPM